MKKTFCLLFLTAVIFNLISKELTIKVIDKDLKLELQGVKITINALEKAFITDKNGIVKIKVDDNIDRIAADCTLIGYQLKKVNIKNFDMENIVEMSIEGTVEGSELVIEDVGNEKKEKVGESLVIDSDELKTLSMRGTVEDVISSVKTMPGVSYSAGFMTDLSVRGGSADEIAATYDGFLVRFPFYWGNSTSIFNPNIVDCVRFDNGSIPVKYGFAMSGLLEVNLKTPDQGFRTDTKLAYSTFESLFQIPLDKEKSGLLMSARVTYLDLTIGPIWKATGVNVPRAPYIYDGNIKWFYKPNDKFEWYVNGFVGADGIGMESITDASQGIKTDDLLINNNIHAIGFGGIKALPTDKMFINWFAGYEFLSRKYYETITEKGDKDYSLDFKNLYGIQNNSFSVDLGNVAAATQLSNSAQSRLDIEIMIHDRVKMSFGAGILYDFANDTFENNYFDSNLNLTVDDMEDKGINNNFNNSLYLNFNFNLIPDKLEIDLGARVDHYFSKVGSHIMNTYPVANPRLFISFTPIKNLKGLESFTISFGTGLYSKMPDYPYDIETPISSFTINQEKVLTNVLGFEFMFPYGYNIKLETYAKYYFDRYYDNSYINDNNEKIYINHSDGLGFVAGFDLILKRKISKYLDGWISYSFMYVRYYNPQTDNLNGSTTDSGDPTGIWYYPAFHRWNSMNVVLNIKPLNWLTISPTFGIDSGIPQTTFGDKEMYISYSGSTPLELYRRTERYSDTERTLPSFPLGLKISFNYYYPRLKIGMEIYVSVDNILYYAWDPDKKQIVDKYTGDIIYQPSPAYEVFLPSFGIKLTY